MCCHDFMGGLPHPLDSLSELSGLLCTEVLSGIPGKWYKPDVYADCGDVVQEERAGHAYGVSPSLSFPLSSSQSIMYFDWYASLLTVCAEYGTAAQATCQSFRH